MTKEEFDSAVKQIEEYLRALCPTIDTRTAMNNTLFSVQVPVFGTRSARISFIQTTMDDGSTRVFPNYTDGTYDGGVLADFNNLSDTSLEFRAALMVNWKTLKTSIMTEINYLREAGKKLDDKRAAEAKAKAAEETRIYESVPSGFEI